MSIFASHTTATIEIPFDAPNTVTIRRLTGREIEAAQVAHRDNIMSGSARAWSVTFRRALEKGASDPDVLRALADPLTGYDRYALVRSGLMAWSYQQPINSVKVGTVGEPAKVIDAIDDLDDEAVDFMATEVLRLTKPALFQTAEQAEDEKKKESAPSISG